MHRLSPSQGTLYWAAIRSLLLLLVFAEIVYCSGIAIPNFCLYSRPRSRNEGCTTKRKFFFQPNKLRCKPFPICEEDADTYDLQTGNNYFKTMEDCKQACSEVVQCPTMEPISNGVLDNVTSQGLNDNITYSCVEGYELVGSATRTCKLNGNWSGPEPYCQEQCRTPGAVEKAMFSPVQSYYSVGSGVTYTCDQGHVGGGERVCQLNGTWTEPNMTCQYVECPAVQAITNGVVTEHSREYGSNVTYSCLPGYELIGPSVRECLANGSWSANEPYCQVMCPAPTPSDNAVVSPQSDYYSIGSKVQYTCSVGYGGDAERQCQANGTWSGTQPICEPLQIECPDPVPIQHGYVSAPNLSVGSKLMYFCDVNYTLVGNSTRMCTESGEWSGSKPACARVRLLYGSTEQDVTNSTLPLPSGEKEHRISCVTEPASYPGRVAPEWSVVGNKWPHGVSVDGSQLVFASVFTSGEQKGEYVCTSGEQRATVNVTVVSSNDSNHKPPKLEVPPDTFCAPQGSVAMFQCVFTGCPIPDVSWYHNGTRIQNDNKTKIRDIPFRGLKLCSLMIDGVTTRDVGNYQCIGSNIKGNLSSQVVQLTMRHNGISKRSVQTDIRHHCREDPRAVTVVGQLHRIIKKAAKNFPVYRIQMHKVLRGTEAILGERKRMTVLMPPTQNPTLRLQQDTTYIITGINIDNKLLFVDHNSIQTHSNELEDLIQTC